MPDETPILIEDITKCLDHFESGRTFLEVDSSGKLVPAYKEKPRELLLICEWVLYGMEADNSSGVKVLAMLLPHGKIDVLEVFLTNSEENEYLGTVKVFSLKYKDESGYDPSYKDILIDLVRTRLYLESPQFMQSEDEHE